MRSKQRKTRTQGHAPRHVASGPSSRATGPEARDAASILRLQRLAGNRSVVQLLMQRRSEEGADDAAPLHVARDDDAAAADASPAEGLPQRTVSGKAMERLGKAKEAIEHAKSVFKYGAGNQRESLEATKFNSYFRSVVIYEDKYWRMTPEVTPIAVANPSAYTAAKAEIVHGGNCDQHAKVAFDYLRVTSPGERINTAMVEGVKHAFVIMGDVASEPDTDLVVSDPWPTRATATLWDDHFAYTADRTKIKFWDSMIADGMNVKSVILAGLTLTDEGQQVAQQSYDENTTKELIDSGMNGYIWDHRDAAAAGRKFEYTEEGGGDDGPDGPDDDRLLRSPRFAGDPRLEAAVRNSPPLKMGAKPPESVAKIQQALVDDGFAMPKSTRTDGTMDGIYGWETHSVVYKFQVKHGLGKDGVVGAKTMTRIDELYR